MIFKDEEKIPDEFIGPITDAENYVLGFLEEICLGLVPKPDRITKALADDDVKPTDLFVAVAMVVALTGRQLRWPLKFVKKHGLFN
ncbi:hypothetical protein ACVWXO_001933 [Bradyrhizobium sp. LM2.7]